MGESEVPPAHPCRFPTTQLGQIFFWRQAARGKDGEKTEKGAGEVRLADG